jgi:hypothetical protein
MSAFGGKADILGFCFGVSAPQPKEEGPLRVAKAAAPPENSRAFGDGGTSRPLLGP